MVHEKFCRCLSAAVSVSQTVPESKTGRAPFKSRCDNDRGSVDDALRETAAYIWSGSLQLGYELFNPHLNEYPNFKEKVAAFMQAFCC